MELQVYKNAEFGSVRTTTIGGQPYFVGKDVASILGYANTRKALIDHIDEEDKDDVTIRDAIGRNQTMTAINESGLYSLILSSKMPSAKKFKRWVTSEVLPAIRKHGLYATDDLIANPDLAIAAFTALKVEREKNKELMAAVAIGQQQIAEMKPKVSYYDLILQSDSVVSISKIAKDYGMSPQAMNKLLKTLGIQYKQGDLWLLYQKYANQGYTQSKTYALDNNKSRMHTYWTQKGRLFLYDLLKSEKGILPVIERGEANA